jgi:hypothetical protein
MPKKGGKGKGGKKKKKDGVPAGFWKLMPAPGHFDRQYILLMMAFHSLIMIVIVVTVVRDRLQWIPSYKRDPVDLDGSQSPFYEPPIETLQSLSPTFPEKVTKPPNLLALGYN